MGDVDTLDIDTGRLSAQPCWEAGITYKDAFTLGLTGHYGREEIRTYRFNGVADVLGNHGAMIDSWSANVHAIIPLGEMASISGEYYQGVNLDGWYTGGQGNGWVLTEDGDRESLESTGGWVQFMVAPAKPIKVYATFGIDDINDDQLKNGVLEAGYIDADAATAGNQPKSGNAVITKNHFCAAMVDYSVSPSTKISLEWMQVISDYSLADNGAADPNWTPKTGARPLGYRQGRPLHH
ncbi:MAG: hypothetical protein MZU79_02825, partial [Anaerotruncus sp.]|nr:hypothetical protein [Anaerotruncus sp.]